VGGLLKKKRTSRFLDTMKLLGALEILRRTVPPEAPRFRVFLVCGFTPLDWKTYLTANLCLRGPNHLVETPVGLYADLAGSWERLNTGTWEADVVPLNALTWTHDSRGGADGGFKRVRMSNFGSSTRPMFLGNIPDAVGGGHSKGVPGSRGDVGFAGLDHFGAVSGRRVPDHSRSVRSGGVNSFPASLVNLQSQKGTQ
jgi:hypothetical protein